MRFYRHNFILVYFALLSFATGVSAQADLNAPVRGARFDSLVAAQQLELQQALEQLLPESEGYFITGPLDPFVSTWAAASDLLYRSVRVVSPTLEMGDSALATVYYDSAFEITGSPFPTKRADGSAWTEIVSAKWRGREVNIRFTFYETLRADIWAKYKVFHNPPLDVDENALGRYAVRVYDYMKYLSAGMTNASEPDPSLLNLPDSLGLYAEPPDYVIQGYQNYKDSLRKYSPIYTDFAGGILELMPSDSLMNEIKADAPKAAFPNKEWPMIQKEFREFRGHGGDMRSIQTLTRAGFDTLQPGEYLFAVGVNGKVRFAREIPREEVERIEQETGQEVPRVNHAFLFPGEYVLTAGAFFVEQRDGRPIIEKVSAQSGHYFYSNVSPTIQKDIAERSDTYLMTLGHFFSALDRLGIDYDDVLISKLH